MKSVPPIIQQSPPPLPPQIAKSPRKRSRGRSWLQILGWCFVLFFIIPVTIGIVLAVVKLSTPDGSSGGRTRPTTAKQQNQERWTSNLIAEIKDAQGTERESKLEKLIALDPGTKEFPDEIEKIRKQQLDINAKEQAEKRRREAREQRISSGFSPWDGSHRGLTKVIKESMNDPKSYEHVETVYWDQGNQLIVRTTFRGKNGFGGVVMNWVKAETDLDGNVIKIIEQGP